MLCPYCEKESELKQDKSIRTWVEDELSYARHIVAKHRKIIEGGDSKPNDKPDNKPDGDSINGSDNTDNNGSDNGGGNGDDSGDQNGPDDKNDGNGATDNGFTEHGYTKQSKGGSKQSEHQINMFGR